MDRLLALKQRLRQLFLRSAAERRMDEEMRFHLEMEEARLIESGLSPSEARRRARIAFGPVESHRESMRDYRKLPLEDLVRDVRLAIRSVFRKPSLAIVGILTIGIAIGATTAIFSVVDGVLLRPLPYPEPDELVTIRLGSDLDPTGDISFSDRGFWHFHDRNRSFEHFGGYAQGTRPLVGDGEPVEVSNASLTLGAFRAIGVEPILGRLPLEAEDTPGAPPVALISAGLWAERYGSDPNILGRTIDLRGEQVEVIGVMPASYDFPDEDTDLWLPFRLDPASENYGGHYIDVIARLRDGVSVETAAAEARRLIGLFPEAGYGPEVDDLYTGGAVIRTIEDRLVGGSRRPLYVVLGTVGFILLIACGNVANLLLVRAEARSRETAMRMALGAGRRRLVREVFLESLTIAVLGGLLGLLMAYAGTRLLVSLAPAAIPRLDEIRTSGNVLLFATGIVAGSALLVGLLPALHVAAGRALGALIGGGRTTTAGRERHRARGALIVVQVALTLVLVVGSALMVRSFREMRAIDLGFRPEGVLTFSVYLPGSRYETRESTTEFQQQLVEQLEVIPGVVSAGGVSILPLTGGGAEREATLDGYPSGPDAPLLSFPVRIVTAGYFETMGIPLIEGRRFDAREHEQGLASAIVSASLRDAYWPGTSAVGMSLSPGGADRLPVVGTVGSVRDGGMTMAPENLIYLPLLGRVGHGTRGLDFVIRTQGDPYDLVPLVRQTLRRMDPLLPLIDPRRLEGIVADAMSPVTFTMSLLSLGALIAIFLGAVGISGVIGYVVAQRTAEMGIRQALGATPWRIGGMVMRHAMALAVTGVVIGLVVATAMGRSLASLLYQVRALDPVSFAGGSILFLVVAAGAALIPALRAARIQPAVALRNE